MASEPAEPTTRAQLIDRCFSVVDIRMSAYEAVKALAEAGLLADPAQTTVVSPLHCGCADADRLYDELEQAYVSACTEREALSLLLRGMARKLVATRAELKRMQELREAHLEVNRSWVAYRERTKARRRQFLDDIAALTRERDERQARIDATLAVLDGGVEFALMPGALQAVRAALVGDQPKAKAPWFVVRHCCEAGARAYPDTCPWHPALSGEDLRDVEEADDAAGDLP